jgi:hypothetical protein
VYQEMQHPFGFEGLPHPTMGLCFGIMAKHLECGVVLGTAYARGNADAVALTAEQLFNMTAVSTRSR